MAMRTLLYITSILSLALLSCKKESTPGEITYPEYHDGRLNLLAYESDTLLLSEISLDFVLAANVPANRDLRIVCKPAYGTFWNGFGFYISQSNTHLEWDHSIQQSVFTTIEEEYDVDKLCAFKGIYSPFGSTDPNEPNVPIHVIIYEDQTEWMTRYITILDDI